MGYLTDLREVCERIVKVSMFVMVKLSVPLAKMGSMDFTHQLIQKANVAVAPYAGFGGNGEGYLPMALVENEHRIHPAFRQTRSSGTDLGFRAETQRVIPMLDKAGCKC